MEEAEVLNCSLGLALEKSQRPYLKNKLKEKWLRVWLKCRALHCLASPRP
jgi:hypothetical protein